MYKTSDSCQIYNLAEKYMEYFSGKTDGYFVEVGAFDGYSYSNTWGLVEAGWGGHYIEPIPSIFKRCQERYIGNDKIKCHELAIGSFNGEIQILESGEFSTSNKKHIDIYNGANSTAYKGKQWLTVKQKTLNNFLLENNVPKYFDLLCVDVEGNEYDVLKGFNISNYKPKVAIIEMHDIVDAYVNGEVNLKEEYNWILYYFATNNYDRMYFDNINSIFIRNDDEKSGDIGVKSDFYRPI